jgi:hypothetical protein
MIKGITPKMNLITVGSLFWVNNLPGQLLPKGNNEPTLVESLASTVAFFSI